MEALGFTFGQGVYVHCSKTCEHVASTEFGWSPPGKATRAPCPSPLSLSSFFGGEVDDSMNTPEDLTVHGKRQRKAPVNHTTNGTPSTDTSEQHPRAPIGREAGQPFDTPGTMQDSKPTATASALEFQQVHEPNKENASDRMMSASTFHAQKPAKVPTPNELDETAALSAGAPSLGLSWRQWKSELSLARTTRGMHFEFAPAASTPRQTIRALCSSTSYTHASNSSR
jgi:hypothetical protein